MLNDRKEVKYRRFVEQLYLKCQEVQDENERYVYRICKMKQMIKRQMKDISMLKNHLDRYNDGWRHIPLVIRSRKNARKGQKQKNKNLEPKVRKRKSRKGKGLNPRTSPTIN